jgi:hypothetical protein
MVHEEGGIFLSTNIRDEYFAIQNELTDTLKNAINLTERVKPEIRQKIYDKFSSLRTKLTEDLGSSANSLFVNDKIKYKQRDVVLIMDSSSTYSIKSY